MVGRTAVATYGPSGYAGQSASRRNLFNDKFDVYARDLLSQWNNVGVSLAIIDGEEVHANGYGHATLPGTASTPETLYYTGSTTKAYTAALLSHLINSKKYPALADGWDTPISSILGDDFVLQGEWATKHLTLKDAAGHFTGMSRHDLSLLRETGGKESANRDYVRNMRHLPYVTEPRKQFQYCNYMYFTLSHVIETVTGQWLGDALRQHIFEPLGMHATFLDLKMAEKAPGHLATSYFWSEDDKKFKEIPHMPARQLSGAGGLISTALDYTKWLKSLISKADFFNEATHKDIRTSTSIASASDETVILYGMGWMWQMVYGNVAYIHNGSTGTFGSYVIWFPHIKFGVVAFSNGFESAVPVTNILAWRLIADKLGIPEHERVDVNKKLKDAEEKSKANLNNAVQILYPNRPDKPIPPALPASHLAGKYHHAAYGTHDLTEEPHPERKGETVLVTERPDGVFPVRIRFEHVSGEFWIAFVNWLPTDSANTFQAVEFKYGVDGNPSGFEMDIESREEGVIEGKVFFGRMD